MGNSGHVWKFCTRSGLKQVKIGSGADLAALKNLDRKLWTVLAAANAGLRFDKRTLELLDSDGDGRVRVPEVLAAVDFLKSKGVDLDTLFKADEEDGKLLEEIVAKQNDLAKVEPSEAEKSAMRGW